MPNKQEEREKLESRLPGIALFADFAGDEEAIAKIISLGTIKRFARGAHIIDEGDEGDFLYVLLEGSVRILKTTLQNQPYTVTILREQENVYFGEVAMIDRDKRSATVVAESDCALFSIFRDDFLAFCEENPYMGYKITMQIAGKLAAGLRKMNRDVVTLFEALVSEVEGETLPF
jgi:CRP-like cAMP-binding protein